MEGCSPKELSNCGKPIYNRNGMIKEISKNHIVWLKCSMGKNLQAVKEIVFAIQKFYPFFLYSTHWKPQ